MKILIITRSFAPDSGIAAKRPSYFAKYLKEYGHDVYVIRSGMIFTKPDKELAENTRACHIYSYEGQNSDAEKYNLGNYVEKEKALMVTPIRNQNSQFRKCARWLYYNVRSVFISYIKNAPKTRRKILEIYNSSPELRGFEVVLSSFGPLGCIQAGRIISKKEQCAWVIDFRDLMDRSEYPLLLRVINSFAQKKYLRQADCCLCVSEGNAARLSAMCNGRYSNKVFCVYNGFINQPKIEPNAKKDPKLHICYTGTVYSGDKFNTEPLYCSLKNANIQPNDVIIDYAGRDSHLFKQQAEAFGYSDSIIDHHILSRSETAQLQAASDLFLIVSWNNKREQGILTGKFYEALQHRKPVVALVSGDEPNSELKMLIDKYHLGFCYEENGGSNSELALSVYLQKQYLRKRMGEPIEYKPDEAVFSRFEYGTIVRELEKRMMEINMRKEKN